MAGFTDAAFRSLCIDFGANFTFTEMVSSQAVSRKNEKTLRIIEPAPNERLFGVQMFASDPGVAVKSAKEIESYNPSLIDLNCGCSIPKILKAGCGAALLDNPGKIGEIIRALKDTTDVPISIKIRSGASSSAINYLEVGAIAEKAGACLLSLHPRTRSEVFRGKANWDHIRLLKESVSVPVIGSGDLFTPEDVRDMLARTGCDGVMIARGAIGNPMIFGEVRDLLATGAYEKHEKPEQRLATALAHTSSMVRFKGEKRGCMEMRKHFCAYTKGLPDSCVIRNAIVHASTYADYETIVSDYLAKPHEHGIAAAGFLNEGYEDHEDFPAT